jgi:hypothetical protein
MDLLNYDEMAESYINGNVSYNLEQIKTLDQYIRFRQAVGWIGGDTGKLDNQAIMKIEQGFLFN